MPKKPLFPHVPSKREPLFPHRTVETGESSYLKETKFEIPKTRVTSLGIDLELPVARAVEALVDENPWSSGFHGALNQRWMIVFKGKISDRAISAAKVVGLDVSYREAPKGSGQILTDVSLPGVGIREIEKATEAFNRFAELYEGALAGAYHYKEEAQARTAKSYAEGLGYRANLRYRNGEWDLTISKPSYLKEPLPEMGELVSPQYRDLIGFISEPIPEFSLLTLPLVEAEVGETKLEAVLKTLKNGVEGIQDSHQFRLFLTTMSKFHIYSIGNQILIMLQDPNATHVAGFVTWKELGRWVKRGGKSISILAPVMPPKPKKEEKGEEEEEEIVPLTPVYFKVVSVFDIAQTDGKPLPEFDVPVLTGEVNEVLFTNMMALTRAQSLGVSFESRPHQDPDIKGQYSPPKSIWIRPEEPRAQQLKSLLHEVAHSYSEGVLRIPRRDAETIAESAAFVIGAHYGFDTGVRSFPYVALWAQDKKVLNKNLGDIRKVATTILEGLEK